MTLEAEVGVALGQHLGIHGAVHRVAGGATLPHRLMLEHERALLGLMSSLSPKSMAQRTLTIFSTHDPDDGMSRLSSEDIKRISHFYHRHSSRQGALNDATHAVGTELLRSVRQPVLVIHSREDNSVPFSHAEWSLENIPHAELYEAGFTGHFFWIGPDYKGISERLTAFLHSDLAE